MSAAARVSRIAGARAVAAGNAVRRHNSAIASYATIVGEAALSSDTPESAALAAVVGEVASLHARICAASGKLGPGSMRLEAHDLLKCSCAMASALDKFGVGLLRDPGFPAHLRNLRDESTRWLARARRLLGGAM